MQLSTVQTLLSMQGLGPGRQLPAEQTSGPVHGLPSLQLFVLSLTCEHSWPTQKSSEHAFPSSQSAAVRHCTSVAPMFNL